jgi:hypothetical protein
MKVIFIAIAIIIMIIPSMMFGGLWEPGLAFCEAADGSWWWVSLWEWLDEHTLHSRHMRFDDLNGDGDFLDEGEMTYEEYTVENPLY